MHNLLDKILLRFAIWFENYLHENHRHVSKHVADTRLKSILDGSHYDEDGFPIQPCCPDSWMHCKKTCPR